MFRLPFFGRKESTPQFDASQALNNTKFNTYLANVPDSALWIANGDDKKLHKQYEAFQQKEKVSDEVVAFYKESIAKDLGLPMEDAQLDVIRTALESQSINNPRRIERLSSKMEKFASTRAEVNSIQNKIASLGTKEDIGKKIEELRQKDADIARAARTMSGFGLGFLGRGVVRAGLFAFDLLSFNIGAHENARKKMRAYNLILNKSNLHDALDDNYDKLKETRGKLKDLKGLEKSKEEKDPQFARMRDDMFSAVIPMAELAKVAQEKAKTKINELLTTNVDFAKLKQAQDILENISDENKDDAGLLYDEHDPHELEALQQSIDAKMEYQVQKEIEDVLRAPLSSHNPYNQLVSSLKPFIENSRIGTYEGEDAKVFLEVVIENILATIPPADNVKRLLIQQVLANLQSK